MWGSSINGRPVLERAHYIILPIFWEGESQDSLMEKNLIQQGLDQIQQQYAAMSYGKHTLTFEIWDQSVLQGVTRQNADFGNSEQAARDYVASQGYIEFSDYTSIILMYNTAAQGPFRGAGTRCILSRSRSHFRSLSRY